MPYPPLSLFFSVTITGFPGDMDFSEVSGIDAKIETDPVKEGGVNGYKHELPKGVSFSHLVLKRGLLKNSALMTWIQNAVNNFKFAPKQVLVDLLNSNHDILVTWTFENAYPVAVKIGELKAQDGAILIETLELAYNSFSREDHR